MQIGCFQHGMGFLEYHICSMKRIILILMMTGLAESIFSQLPAHLEPAVLAYEPRLSDPIMGNNLIAMGAHASNFLIGLHLENRYSIRASNAAAFAIIIPSKNNRMALGASTAGFSAFRDWSFHAGDAIILSKNMSLGLKLLISGTQIKNNKDLMQVGYQIGMGYAFSEKTQCQLHFTNTRPILTLFNDNIQGRFQIQAGVAQVINPDLIITCDFDQWKGSNISISPGMAWNIEKNIQLLAGLKPLPGEAYMGIGWKQKQNNMIILISHHPYLGNSFALRYSFEKK